LFDLKSTELHRCLDRREEANGPNAIGSQLAQLIPASDTTVYEQSWLLAVVPQNLGSRPHECSF
jgi:hypothetical protein